VQALREGLRPPVEVTRATRDYLAQEDVLGQWLEGRKRCPAKAGQRAADLLVEYQHSLPGLRDSECLCARAMNRDKAASTGWL
jgi:hypothetical protein